MAYRLSSVAAVAALSPLMAGLAGCGGNTSLGPSANALTSVRFVNAYQPPTTIDVGKTGQTLRLATGLTYGTATAYQTTSAENGVDITAFQAGTSTAIVTDPVNLPSMISGQLVGVETVVVAGVGGGAHGPTIVRIDDNPLAVGNIASGVAELKIVNLVPDSVSIGLYNTSGTPPTAVAVSGLQSVAYLNESGYTPFSVTGTPNLTVRDNGGNVLATVTLPASPTGHSFSIFVVGEETPTAGGAAVSALVAQDD